MNEDEVQPSANPEQPANQNDRAKDKNGPSAFVASLDRSFKEKKEETLTVSQYFDLCQKDPSVYQSVAEQLVEAINQSVTKKLAGTSRKHLELEKDDKLQRIFGNNVVPIYPALQERRGRLGPLYGVEDTLHQLVDFLKGASQGATQDRQFIYIQGPAGAGKTLLANKIGDILEELPMYILRHKESGEPCPNYDSPLSLLKPEDADKLGIPQRHLIGMSDWTERKLKNEIGEKSLDEIFTVEKIYPSVARNIGFADVSPDELGRRGPEALIGKMGKRDKTKTKPATGGQHKIKEIPYDYSGALSKGNLIILEDASGVKADDITPLLSVTETKFFTGDGEMGRVPANPIVIIIGHQPLKEFVRGSKNEAGFLRRGVEVKMPFVTRMDAEIKALEAIIEETDLKDKKIAPYTLEYLSQFTLMTRLPAKNTGNDPETPEATAKKIYRKMMVYSGYDIETLQRKYGINLPGGKKEFDREIANYRQEDPNTGMTHGVPTPWAGNVLTQTFNYISHISELQSSLNIEDEKNKPEDKPAIKEELEANPVTLFEVLDNELENETVIKDTPTRDRYKACLKFLKTLYLKDLEKHIKDAYTENAGTSAQSYLEEYLTYVGPWKADESYRDPQTGENIDHATLNEKLDKTEKYGSIDDPGDFRQQAELALNYYRAGKTDPASFPTIEEIENAAFTKAEALKPLVDMARKRTEEDQRIADDRMKTDMESIIAFGRKSTEAEEMRQKGYIQRMVNLGYNEKQVRIVTAWYLRQKKGTTHTPGAAHSPG